MAFTFNGIGTKYYGKRALPDGSYVTTKWFVLVFVPVMPLGSFRVVDEGAASYMPSPGVYRSQALRTQRIPLDARQVVQTYWIAAVLIGFVVLAVAASP